MAGYALIRVDRIDKVNGNTHDPLYWNAQQFSPSGWREIHRSMDIKHGLISGKSNKNVQEAQGGLMALLRHQGWRLDPDIEQNDLPNYLGFHMTRQLPPTPPSNTSIAFTVMAQVHLSMRTSRRRMGVSNSTNPSSRGPWRRG